MIDQIRNTKFKQDILEGLQRQQKRLPSKYFYDTAGDDLFQQIMGCQDYYLTRCEMEIFKDKTVELAQTLTAIDEEFDIIELGAGDASKSYHLFKHLSRSAKPFNYYPIDISGHILNVLKQNLNRLLPSMPIQCLEGEYFDMLEKVSSISQNKKVIMFLGSNIGNMVPEDAFEFCIRLRNCLNVGDLVLMGFDLKKNPKKISLAYNDRGGLTARFNLNLLARINRELDATFKLNQFEHFQNYDPVTGACKSYLISLQDQTVVIAGNNISFTKDEAIFMEISQKYSLKEIESLATKSGFAQLESHFDTNKWFTDTYWAAI